MPENTPETPSSWSFEGIKNLTTNLLGGLKEKISGTPEKEEFPDEIRARIVWILSTASMSEASPNELISQDPHDIAQSNKKVEEVISEVNTMLTKAKISPEQLKRWLESRDLQNRFWIDLDGDVPHVSLNHFNQFHRQETRNYLGGEVAKVAHPAYLDTLNRAIAMMQPPAAPGELERYARSQGWSIVNGKLAKKADSE